MTIQPENKPPVDESSPWQQYRDQGDKFWLNGELMHQWKSFEEFGVTEELFIAWSMAMRRPIWKWQEMKCYPTTEERFQELRLDERCRLARETALVAFREFLQYHPELPTAAIRPLLEATVDEYYFRHRGFDSKVIQKEKNLFLDEALRLYREGELPAVKNQVSQQQIETHSAVTGEAKPA